MSLISTIQVSLLYCSDLTVHCCHIELNPVQDTQRTQTDWGVHVRKDKVSADLNAVAASEQLFWKQNLYKVTDLVSMHILTKGRAQDSEHIPKTPNNPVWSFKSSHENVNFISAFFIASSYFLLPSTGSKGYHGTGAHPSSHQSRGGKALWTGHQSILQQTHDPVTHLDWEAIYCVWTLGGNGENVRTPRWEAQSTERKTISPRGDHGNRCTSVPTCLKTTNNISMRWRWRNYQTH